MLCFYFVLLHIESISSTGLTPRPLPVNDFILVEILEAKNGPRTELSFVSLVTSDTWTAAGISAFPVNPLRCLSKRTVKQLTVLQTQY